jgi:hypothetical protein
MFLDAREALKTRASKPGAIGAPNSRLSDVAGATSSCGSEMSAGVIRFVTSAAGFARAVLGGWHISSLPPYAAPPGICSKRHAAVQALGRGGPPVHRE